VQANKKTMNPIPLPAPGIHYGISFENYTAWPAINFSRLKAIYHTASKCKWEMDHPKQPTAAMILGSALHVATLEPARFDGMFHICPPADGRTSEGKKIIADAQLAANGKALLRSGKDDNSIAEIESLRGMAESIRSRKTAQSFLTATAQNEVSMLWKDSVTGLMCKGRMDRFAPKFPAFNRPLIIELKKTRCASDWSFAKDIDSFHYDAQAACYRSGIAAITGERPAHVFLCAESEPPFDAQEHMLDDESQATGDAKYRMMLDRYAECVKSGKWPGYPDQLNVIRMPNYAINRNND
jgi:PDDEXK-like domain of unknown function (DUF3799)